MTNPETARELRDRLVAAIRRSPYQELRAVDVNGPLRITVNVDDLADTLMAVVPVSRVVDRATLLQDFLWRLEQSAGDAAAEKFLDDNPDLDEPRRVAAETQDAPGLSELESAARTVELDRDAAASGESRDYRRGMTRAVEVLRLLDAPEAPTTARPVVVEQPDTQETRVVAYVLASRTDLHCPRCAPYPLGDIWTPVTAEELEDGGICSACGVDVLIPQDDPS